MMHPATPQTHLESPTNGDSLLVYLARAFQLLTNHFTTDTVMCLIAEASAPDGSSYLHSPLADGQIRILELLPARFGEKIKCILRPENLDLLPEYETVSYVWGEQNVTTTISVNDEDFDVTVNLEAALQHIRNRHGSRLLWVDAICINQIDGAEKRRQIRQMRDIYQKCERVLIWMGEFMGLDLAFHEVQSFFKTMTVLAEDGQLREADLNQRFFTTLKKFMEASWWTRLWTVQEVLLPRAGVVLWGTESILWSVLEEATWSSLKLDSWPPLSWTEAQIVHRFTGTMQKCVDAKHDGVDEFCHTLWRFMDRETSEPRDKIFGLFGLLPPHERTVFHIPEDDYESDLIIIHFKLAVELIRTTNSLKCFIGLTGALGMIPRYPTWAMDWGSSSSTSHLCPSYWHHAWVDEKSDASAGRPLNMSVNEQDLSITLSGIAMDNIVWVHAISGMAINDSDHALAEPIKDLYDDLPPSVVLEGVYPHISPSMTNEDVIMRTLLNDCVIEITKNIRPRRVIADDNDLFDIFLNGCMRSNGECLCFSLLSYANGHVFFITAEGMFGMGPRHTKIGDEVWVLFGGRTPYVLRPAVKFGQGHYTFVGDCYVDGVMDGEAVSEGVLAQDVTLH